MRVGPIPDGPPDVLAFSITVLMTLLFFHGVKKSVMFNHVLNVFNVLSWLTIMLCGPRHNAVQEL